MSATVRRATVVLAMTPLVSLPMAAAFAVTSSGGPAPRTVSTTHIDAPAASASAAAADLDGILAIGKTSTQAGSGGGKASADALDVLGTRVVGGDTTQGSSATGNLVGTGATPAGDAEVAPYSAVSSQQGGGWKAVADAALLHADVADVVELYLLHSHSESVWGPDSSTGDASSDGGEVNLGGGALDVKVLHSEAHSGKTGSSALLVVNGTAIGSSEQANGSCQLSLDPVLDLLCLQASGGTGADGVTSSGGTVAQASGVLPATTLSGSSSAGGRVQTPAVRTPRTTHHPAAQHSPGSSTAAGGRGELPFTGVAAGLLSAYGAALTALGAALAVVARRRPRHASSIA